MLLRKFFAFTIIELLIVIGGISILAIISYPIYTYHLIHIRRLDAKILLLQTAALLENYAIENGGYNGISLKDLGVSVETEDKTYKVQMESDVNTYRIQATPINVQSRDRECGAFLLNHLGEKFITGHSSIKKCWG